MIDHQGMGGVRVDLVGDEADIVIGEADANGRLGRDVTIENSNAVTVNGEVSLAVTAVGDGGINISGDATVNHSAAHGQINVTGGAVIDATGENRINAYEGTTVASTSSNRLTHDGDRAVVIDDGAIETSGAGLEQMERDVTVTSANSVTVYSGITMRTQNGDEFTMGGNREETIEALVPDQQGLSPEFCRRHRRNPTVGNTRLRNFLAWTMEHFDISPSELKDFLDKSFVLPHIK